MSRVQCCPANISTALFILSLSSSSAAREDDFCWEPFKASKTWTPSRSGHHQPYAYLFVFCTFLHKHSALTCPLSGPTPSSYRDWVKYAVAPDSHSGCEQKRFAACLLVVIGCVVARVVVLHLSCLPRSNLICVAIRDCQHILRWHARVQLCLFAGIHFGDIIGRTEIEVISQW